MSGTDLPPSPSPAPLRISVIVPTLNEADGVGRCLASLRAAAVDEIIVVDGGSHDGTLERARAQADRVFEGESDLFAQLNRGAREATGEVLLFHYADVLFPAGGRSAIEGALQTPDRCGGAFRLVFASPERRYRVTACLANLRNRCGIGPFGDQSIFVRAAVFAEVGGFQEALAFADHALVRRLHRAGRFTLLETAVQASARRWEQLGFFRTLAFHYGMYVRYFAPLQQARTRAKARELRTVR
jgi:rSAM/selenodomain-associated transferase 2